MTAQAHSSFKFIITRGIADMCLIPFNINYELPVIVCLVLLYIYALTKYKLLIIKYCLSLPLIFFNLLLLFAKVIFLLLVVLHVLLIVGTHGTDRSVGARLLGG